MKIDFGVAASKSQSPSWWGSLVATVYRMAKHPKIDIGGLHFIGSALTDYNRNEIVDAMMQKDSDALWFWDDDTIPSPNALPRLIALDADVANGIYYLRSGEHTPVAYGRHSSGMYAHLSDFTKGEIKEVDSCGMGNTLIKRHVFEAIREHYVCYKDLIKQTWHPVHQDDVQSGYHVPGAIHERAPALLQGPGQRAYMVRAMKGPMEPEVFPYFGLEVGRTEDHWFCEMVKRLGFTILCDTWVEATHLHEAEISGHFFRHQQGENLKGKYLQTKGVEVE